jgi:poly(ADP-ribose) glycohydrolase ARH3
MRHDVMAGALLGTLVADSVGLPWEGSGPETGRRGLGRLNASLAQPELVYSDDTQLTLALAEHLLEDPDVDPVGLARTFHEHYEPWRGYAGGMHGLVAAWAVGMDVETAATSVFPDGSFGNGAAMRVAPVGVLWAGHPERLTEAATRQARVTHAHPIGMDAALAQARAVGVAATRGSFSATDIELLARQANTTEVREGLVRAAELAERWDDGELDFAAVATALGNRVIAHRSVPAALWAAAVGGGFPYTVELCLGLGGDADTIAAMAGAIAGVAGTATAIPAEWLALCEDGPRGKGYALDLAERLAQRSP